MEVNPDVCTKKTVDELSNAEKDTLRSWVDRFRAKYTIVGFLNDGANPTTVADARARGYI
jgi:hypothetical protein